MPRTSWGSPFPRQGSSRGWGLCTPFHTGVKHPVPSGCPSRALLFLAFLSSHLRDRAVVPCSSPKPGPQCQRSNTAVPLPSAEGHIKTPAFICSFLPRCYKEGGQGIMPIPSLTCLPVQNWYREEKDPETCSARPSHLVKHRALQTSAAGSI